MMDSPFNYRIILTDISEGKGEAFEAYVPAFNAHHLGETPKEALDAYEMYFQDELERRNKKGLQMPKPDIPKSQKQIPIRMDGDLFERITTLAKQQGISFNRFVVQVVEEASTKFELSS